MSKPNKHGGKRIPGPGKSLGPKPSSFPSFLKKFRATDEEREQFYTLLTGDARQDFLRVMQGLRQVHTLLNYSKPSLIDQALSIPEVQEAYQELINPYHKRKTKKGKQS